MIHIHTWEIELRPEKKKKKKKKKKKNNKKKKKKKKINFDKKKILKINSLSCKLTGKYCITYNI